MTLALGVVLHLLAAGASWQPVTPGAETLTVDDGGSSVQMVRFDLQKFRPEVVVTGGDGETATALRRGRSAVAAINGGFFDTDRRPLGLRIAGGKTTVPLRRGVDWGVLVLRPGQAQIVHSREFRPDTRIDGAIQVGPRLLTGGKPLRLKPQVARRTAVALDRSGRFLTLVAVSSGIEAGRLAGLLADLGFHAALLMDGGASTQMSVELGGLKVDVPGMYGVPDALVVRRR